MRLWRNACMIWMGVIFLFGITDAEARVIDPPAGNMAYQVGADEEITLHVNTTPDPGQTPALEWFVFTTSRTLSDIYIISEDSIQAYDSKLELAAFTYPFSHAAPTQPITTLKLSDIGLFPGDTLYYAYAYTPSDLNHISIRNVVTISITAADEGLIPFTSDTEIKGFLKRALRNITEPWTDVFGGGAYAPAPPGPPAPEPEGDAFESAQTVSGTNLQEEKVDEADLIKTDGSYLYIAPLYLGDTYRPVPDFLGTGNPSGDQAEPEIRVLRLAENPPSAVPVGGIPLDRHETVVNGLYLLSRQNTDSKNLLVTIGGRPEDLWGFWGMPYIWNSGKTEVVLYDVEAPATPRLVTRLALDGFLISSRMVGNTLYLVTRFTPKPVGYDFHPYWEDDQATNEILLEWTGLPELLPQFSVNGIYRGPLINTDHCYRTRESNTEYTTPNIITVTAIDIHDPENPVSRSFIGNAETFYMSANSLYIADTVYHGGTYAGIPELDAYTRSTTIHKFALEPEGPEYRGTGSVPGNLGWEADKKPFRMSERGEILRIASSIGRTSDGSASTRLTMLKETEAESDQLLSETAHIDGIGEEGERLYAVRYAGRYGYLVTFRVTDPLYIFDLSDPENPIQVGELHIDGYSDYLHPISETLLLGIGKDAVPATTATDFGGRGAWYQGVKLSLFDISNPADPREVDSEIIGKRGTESDVLYDHHALAYLPPGNGRPARLALPVQLHEASDGMSTYPWEYFEWTHTGLYMFDIEAPSLGGLNNAETGDIRPRGRIVAEHSSEEGPYFRWGFGWTDRAVIQGEAVHYIHNTGVWSANWGAGESGRGPQ